MKNQPHKQLRVGKNRASAAALVEFAVALVLFLPVLFAFCDFFMLIFNSQLNDSVCQDAARVAAIGDPRTAQARAAAIVARANDQSSSRYKLISVTSTAPSGASSQGGAVSGNVTVETGTVFTPQILRWLCPGQGAVNLRAKQTYPFTYITPSPGSGSTGS